MTLQKEDRNVIVIIRLQRANTTFEEAKSNLELGYWRVTVNRLYYACYYAASALLIKNGFTAHTHTGVISQLGLHFVKTGVISMSQGKLLKQLFALRQIGDYDDWVEVDESDVLPLLDPAHQFIETIEKLIYNNDK